MSDTNFDPTKPVQTRDGRKARIICTDRRDRHFPIVALVGNSDEPMTYTSCGRFDVMESDAFDTPSDLINVEPCVEDWANVYEQTGVGAWWNNVGATREVRIINDNFVCTLKRTREGSRVISVEVVDFAKEVQ